MPNDQSDRETAFRKVVESASCVILILREDHTIAYFSPFAEQLTGYAASDVMGKDCFRLFLPESEHQNAAAEVRQVAVGGAATRGYETPFLCRNGEWRWLLWNVQRLDEYDSQPAVLAVGHDVTESRHAREALQDRESRLQAILETAVDGIITIDERGLIHSVNRAAEEIFGYPSEEMLGNNVRMLMPSPYREQHDDYLANYARTGEKKIIGMGRQVEGRRKDGSTFPIDIAVSEVMNGAQDRQFTGIVRDITDRRRAEERAMQSERLAAIGQMITGLAHESRNAFQRSQACLELLELEIGDLPEALQLVHRLQRALDHLHHLYEEVRDYAAPIRLRREVCDLARVWRDTWAHLEEARVAKSVSLNERTEGVDLSCNIDPIACEQLFRNVLENAIAACSERGEILIRCAETRLGRLPAIAVSIRDNGPGFEATAKQKVFEPFFTTKTKGTGLGMAIAQRIVEAHGGEIEIGEGTPGAEVLLTIPRGNR